MGEIGAVVVSRVVGEIDSVGVGDAAGVARAGRVGEAGVVDVGKGLDVANGIAVASWAIEVDPGVLEPPQPVTMVMSKSIPPRSL